MANCYRIPYRDRFGEHQATKWGETPQDAIASLKKSRAVPGIGGTECGIPVLIDPQPFSRITPPPREMSV